MDFNCGKCLSSFDTIAKAEKKVPASLSVSLKFSLPLCSMLSVSFWVSSAEDDVSSSLSLKISSLDAGMKAGKSMDMKVISWRIVQLGRLLYSRCRSIGRGWLTLAPFDIARLILILLAWLRQSLERDRDG